MNTVTTSGSGGRWWLSLLYIAVILTLSSSGIFSFGIASFVWSNDSSPASLGKLSGVVAVGGAPLVAAVCWRVRAVRSRLRPGAVSIAASAAAFLAVVWTVLVVFGYQENAADVWRHLPFSLGVCAPTVIVATCALTISRFIQRDDARRAAMPSRPPEKLDV